MIGEISLALSLPQVVPQLFWLIVGGGRVRGWLSSSASPCWA
jgi:hypothetical protein